MLKVVVQAIPTFSMSCFKLPIGLCYDIELMICKFWCVNVEIGGRYIGKKWEILCKPKSKGGMDFRELEKFNGPMLAK